MRFRQVPEGDYSFVARQTGMGLDEFPTKSQDTTLTGWTKTGAAGDILVASVDSCTTITKCLIVLTLTRA